MNKMKKLIYLLTLIIPLSAQEAKDDPFHDSVGKETEKEETITQKAVRHIQDAEWRKFQAAHRRAHSKRGEEHSVRESRGKKHKVRQLVRLVVVGGLAYYIGYHQGEEHFKGGWNKRKYDWGERE
jgi:hypothetical protein